MAQPLDCGKYCDPITAVTDGSNLSSASISSQQATRSVQCAQCTSGCSFSSQETTTGGFKKNKKKGKSKKWSLKYKKKINCKKPKGFSQKQFCKKQNKKTKKRKYYRKSNKK